MDQDLSKFEQESTKAPIWLPIIGVIVFFVVMILATMMPGERMEPPDGGAAQVQGE